MALEDRPQRLHLQVIARHPIVVTHLSQILSADPELGCLVSSTPVEYLAAVSPEACLCILDGWSLHDQLIDLSRLVRVRCPGSKFLALVPPEKGDNEEMVRLLYAGIDGVVKVAAHWQEELLTAARGILEGKLWFPPQVISEYVRNTNLLLDRQAHPDLTLTGRENQVLQLMIRRLSNKEIGAALGIVERTVKFHVSNILGKMRVETRSSLFTVIDNAPQAIGPGRMEGPAFSIKKASVS